MVGLSSFACFVFLLATAVFVVVLVEIGEEKEDDADDVKGGGDFEDEREERASETAMAPSLARRGL